MNRYSTHISWSGEDQEYVATCPQFPGLSAFGKTPEEAVREAQIALELFIDTYNVDGVHLPQPQVAHRNTSSVSFQSEKFATPESIDPGASGRHS